MTRPAGGWRSLVSGGAVLSTSMLAANAANYATNALAGRWFEAQAFADASLIVTLFLVLTIGSVALQLLTAGRASQGDGAAPATRWLRRRAWQVGLVTGALLALGAPAGQQLFSTSSAVPFALLGAGVPFYFALSVDRGALQGGLRFGAMALTYLVEACVRLGATVALAAAGLGASGVAGALSLSFVATWLAGRVALPADGAPGELPLAERAALLRHAQPVAVLLVGQVLVSNADILVVKAFRPTEAATYAAVALVGRAVFFCSWAVVSTLFPVAGAAGGSARAHRRLHAIGVLVVGGTGALMTLGAAVAGGPILRSLLGDDYAGAAPLLWRYALATTAFGVTNLLASLDVARGSARGAQLVLAGGVVQLAALLVSTGSLRQVVDAQVFAMVLLGMAAGADQWLRTRSDLHPVADAAHRADAAGAVPRVDLLA